MAEILVIDDSEITLSIMEAVLVKAGHRVDSAMSLAEGLARLESGQAYDLLLMDVVLPDGNGIACIPRAKARWMESWSRSVEDPFST